jgi:hypothetical protein
MSPSRHDRRIRSKGSNVRTRASSAAVTLLVALVLGLAVESSGAAAIRIPRIPALQQLRPSVHRRRPADPTSSNVVDAYARDVVAGQIPAGKYHRLACERHLRDRQREGAKGSRIGSI